MVNNKRFILGVLILVAACGLSVTIRAAEQANKESAIKVLLLGKKSATIEQAQDQRNWWTRATLISVSALALPLGIRKYMYPDKPLSRVEQKSLMMTSFGLIPPLCKLGYAQWDLSAKQRKEEEREAEALRRHAIPKSFF